MDRGQFGIRELLTALDGIPDRDCDGPRQTLASVYAKRVNRTYRPPSDEARVSPAPVRVLVANGIRITGEPAGTLVNAPRESSIPGVGFSAAYLISHSLAKSTDYAKATMSKVRSGRVGKKDGGGYKRPKVGDCIVRAGRV
jgi:hypothetical protein